MSEFLVLTGVDGPESLERATSRLDRLAAVLAPESVDLELATHRAGGSRLVELSTDRASRTVHEWVTRFHRTAHARVSFSGEEMTISTPLVTSRTLWHFRDRSLDIVSTSMRAVAFLRGAVDLDPEAPAWMLLTGTLGPERSWDRFVGQLPAASVLSPVSGRVSQREMDRRPPRMNTREDWGAELARRLRAAIRELDLDPGEWTLPLSGGVDSRGLAFLLGTALPTVTWGSPGHDGPGSDIALATEVATKLGLSHRVIEITADVVEPHVVFDRFTAASECRIDHISGYVDGMQLWHDLRAAGVRGIVRGDEVFGWNRRYRPGSTRRSVGLNGADDVVVGDVLAPHLAAVDASLTPMSWAVKSGSESLAAYRDRLYRGFRAPSTLAALTQTKSGYVDLVAPFLADEVVELIEAMPDRLRTDKRLFRSQVVAASHGIAFATRSSLAPSGSFLDLPPVFRSLQDALVASAPVGLPAALVQRLVDAEPPARRGAGPTGRSGELLGRLPSRLRREVALMLAERPSSLGTTPLLFRAALAARGQQMMLAAAQTGLEPTSGHRGSVGRSPG